MATVQAHHDAQEAAARFRAAAQALGDLEPVNSEAGQVIVAAARPPRVTGALAASQFARATPSGAVVAASAPYWTFVHWGAPRRHVRANPWLLAATRASSDEVARLYLTHAQDSLDNI